LPICRELGFEPDIIFTGNRISDQTMVELVEAEMGIGILSSLIAKTIGKQ
jgi:hypothetical protein